MTRLAACFAAFWLACCSLLSAQADRPNVLWVFVEDMNGWFGCYGDELAETPHIDALAARGTRFTRAYMPAGVCSPTRSAVITGCMQTAIGAHHHRSSRGEQRIELPDGVRTVPERFREGGYYTFNLGKTDYNFAHDLGALYDWHHAGMNLDRAGDLSELWQPAIAVGKPFFGQIQLRGGKHRPEKHTDRAAVAVPPYYPDIAMVREEIAHHYDCIRRADAELGMIVTALRRSGQLARTVIMLFSDHGFRMHRHKQFLYEGGIRVPCIVAGPTVPVAVSDDLISGIDLGATSLARAGIDVPAAMQGRDLFGRYYQARGVCFAARDRCDYTIDKIRAVVTPRFKYLRNYLPDRPYMQPQYRDDRPVTRQLRALLADGQLDAVQRQFYGKERPAEELYDLQHDPHEVHDLAGEPSAHAVLLRHRALLRHWIEDGNDLGQQPESEASLRDVLQRWGDRCINPEYTPVRASIARENESKRRVLILGDSISMGYTPIVKRLLQRDTFVVRPKENCAGTSKGVQRIDSWLQLEGGGFDLIWFNFGLHDLKRVQAATGRNSNDPNDARQAEPEIYEQKLRAIVAKLKATGSQLVFATTTPVPAGVRPYRDPADPERYNTIAHRVMAEHDIAVHDLFAFANQRLAAIQRPADVHFTPAGSTELGQSVAERIRAVLAAR